jgi:hypothetical protein
VTIGLISGESGLGLKMSGCLGTGKGSKICTVLWINGQIFRMMSSFKYDQIRVLSLLHRSIGQRLSNRFYLSKYHNFRKEILGFWTNSQFVSLNFARYYSRKLFIWLYSSSITKIFVNLFNFEKLDIWKMARFWLNFTSNINTLHPVYSELGYSEYPLIWTGLFTPIVNL